MRKEFESGLAKRIAGEKAEKKVLGKAFMALALGAILLAGSALTVVAMSENGVNAPGDTIRDQLKDGSCLDQTVESDGICDCTCDCLCDCDCTNPDCPCCDDTL